MPMMMQKITMYIYTVTDSYFAQARIVVWSVTLPTSEMMTKNLDNKQSDQFSIFAYDKIHRRICSRYVDKHALILILYYVIKPLHLVTNTEL